MSTEAESIPGQCPQPPCVVHSQLLDFNADCAECCQAADHTNLIAIGTYQLIEETQERVGRCYLFELQQSGEDGVPTGCRQLGSIDVPGIFDIKWGPPGDTHELLIGAALADGNIRLLDAAPQDGEQPALRELSRCTACNSGGMCLSLDWQVGPSTSTARIATSTSSGTLSLITVAEGGLQLVSEWEAHSLEAWCTAFHKAEPHLLFSGADDCYFKGHDLRADTAGGPSLVFSDRRSHAAGVCTVSPHPHPQHSHLVATGSYDEGVRLWDMRNTAKPVLAAKAETGGGNWRLRWHPRDPHVLLAAAMYNGFTVLRAAPGFGALEVVEAGWFRSPCKAIAYGADWWHGEGGAQAQREQGAGEHGEQGGSGAVGGRALAAMCSFYDRTFSVAWLGTGSAEQQE